MITQEINKWLERPPVERGVMAIEDIFAMGTDIGKSRDENQDRVAVLKISTPQRNGVSWCACVSDGMGGMKDGGKAASLAIAAFFSSLISNRRMEPRARLELAARDANEQVSKDIAGSGATLSAVLMENGALFTVNVGDSRIYQRTSDNRVLRLTVDDTLAEAYGAEDRGLLQYIGSKSRITPHVNALDQQPAQLLLTSDGAHVIGEELLFELGRYAADPLTHCNRVMDLANWIGGKDNASLISIKPLSTPAVVETNSDISIWSVNGRLKIAWSNSRAELSDPREPAPTSSAQSPSSHVDSAPEPKTDEKTKQTQGNQKPRKRKPSKPKKEQIEIGFSDEGVNEGNGNS